MRILAAIALAATLAAGQATVLDRVAAVVNGTPVLASEITDAAWYARLSSGADCAPPLTAAERATALEHLEDAVLLEGAAAAEGYPSAAVEAQTGATMAKLRPRLAACHLEASAAEALVGRQLRILGYLDQHFAGQVTPGDRQIEAYYSNTFVPEAKRRGVAAAPLAQVRDTIAQLLAERQQTRQEQAWLKQLRGEATIEVIAPW